MHVQVERHHSVDPPGSGSPRIMTRSSTDQMIIDDITTGHHSPPPHLHPQPHPRPPHLGIIKPLLLHNHHHDHDYHRHHHHHQHHHNHHHHHHCQHHHHRRRRRCHHRHHRRCICLNLIQLHTMNVAPTFKKNVMSRSWQEPAKKKRALSIDQFYRLVA